MFKRPNRMAPKSDATSQSAAPGNPSTHSIGKPSGMPAKSPVPPGKQASGTQAPGTQAPGKQAYEARRAAKAGVSLDRWMSDKQKRAEAELEAARRARIKAEPVKAGFFKRLLDRAHKPLRD